MSENVVFLFDPSVFLVGIISIIIVIFVKLFHVEPSNWLLRLTSLTLLIASIGFSLSFGVLELIYFSLFGNFNFQIQNIYNHDIVTFFSLVFVGFVIVGSQWLILYDYGESTFNKEEFFATVILWSLIEVLLHLPFYQMEINVGIFYLSIVFIESFSIFYFINAVEINTKFLLFAAVMRATFEVTLFGIILKGKLGVDTLLPLSWVAGLTLLLAALAFYINNLGE